MKRDTTMAIAYKYILEGILSGKIVQGTPISEMEVSQILGISRSPVREALRKLEAEGLIIIFPGRGAFVIEISDQDIREVFELRILLECHSLKRACFCITKEWLIEMKTKINLLSPETSSANDFYAIDFELHSAIVVNGGNKRLIKMYKNVLFQIDMIRRISSMNPQHFATSRDYHLQLIDSIYNRDLDAAENILSEHLDYVLLNTLHYSPIAIKN
ncbi:GntR family transcriptional regulator [Acerihabitans sp. KWT182]|uniref:GntR family transcriptional regulator n=1 Tax=Acerihabitans sp. KWT182 TaxID=3157919 RepID=A0AAU7QB72_9GAMM